jgi:hypothetical protein
MNFQPKTEKEIKEAMLWPKGEYDFECVKAERAKSGPQSKNPGTDYLKLDHRIWNANGDTKFVNAMLHPAMEAQVRHFCVVGNKIAEYDTGTLTPEDCVGVTGKLKLKIKEENGNFPAKNEVQDYIVPKEKPQGLPAPNSPPTNGKEPKDDDVPF